METFGKKDVPQEVGNISDSQLQQLCDWNWHGDSYAPPTIKKLIHEQFRRRAVQRPDAEAVCSWDGSLTYMELDRLASMLALLLQRSYSVEANTMVPLCFEKSKWYVVSMLAVLKAGGAVVPIDPRHPTKRKNTIINLLGTKCPVALTGSAKADTPGGHTGIRTLQVNQALFDNMKRSWLFCPVLPLPEIHAGYPTDPAVVIFTSGSTGIPKGIVQDHRTYCSAFEYHGRSMPFDTHTRMFQYAAHTFDISMGDILCTLLWGGCVCIPSEQDRQNDIASAIQKLRANQLNLTPTVACLLDPADVCPQVETVILIGEALSQQALDRWSNHVNLIQAYGPAEAGVACTVRQHMTSSDAPNHLGRAVGCSIWITDPSDPNILLPIGAEGEILIEGPIVARGYLHNAELTAKSFIRDPKWVKRTSVTSGRRFYRTGDLGRYGPRGNIEFVGRSDFQIKLRGQRIELEEVEAHLSNATRKSRAHLAAAAVTPRGGEKMLVGFVAVGYGGETRAPDDDSLLVTCEQTLHNFREGVKRVKETLYQISPAYMVPAAFIPVCKIPLTPSGKIDRKKLWALAEGMSMGELLSYTSAAVASNRTIIKPTTREEEALCRAWKEVLHLQDISTDDDFFSLGGDSVLAMRLVSNVRKSGFTLTVADINKNPVLMHQAATLTANVDIPPIPPFSLASRVIGDESFVCEAAASACQVDVAMIEDAYPITEMQERFFCGAFMSQDDDATWVSKARDAHDHARQMVFRIRSKANLDHQRFLDAWQTVARRHNILRTRFVRIGDQMLQVVVDDDIPIFVTQDSIDDWLDHCRREPMFWGTPLAHVWASQDGRWFVLSISHAIYDDITLQKIFADVKQVYEQPDAVSEKNLVTMAHFIKYQFDSDRHSAAIIHWCKLLEDIDVKPMIPHAVLDRKKTVQDTDCRKIIRLVDNNNLARHQGSITRATVLQVSAALFLAHHLDCADIVFDCHQSGRTGTLPGVADLVGPTLTSLPALVRIGRDPTASVLEILQQTQQRMEHIAEYESIGWWMLVQMGEFHDVLRGAPLLNILPAGEELGIGLGLEPPRVVARGNEAPFVVMATMRKDGEVELLLASDRECVSAQDLAKHLKRWALVVERVWKGVSEDEGDLSVGDIFDLHDG